MVPVAKGAILLVLLGGATVSTYAVANGGFGNKAKSSEESKETTGTGASEDAKPAATGKSEGDTGVSATGPSGKGERGAQERGEPAPEGDQGGTGTGVAAGGTHGPTVDSATR